MNSKRNKIFLFLGSVFGATAIFLFLLTNNLVYNNLLKAISKINHEDIYLIRGTLKAIMFLNLSQLGMIFLSAFCFGWYFATGFRRKLRKSRDSYHIKH